MNNSLKEEFINLYSDIKKYRFDTSTYREKVEEIIKYAKDIKFKEGEAEGYIRLISLVSYGAKLNEEEVFEYIENAKKIYNDLNSKSGLGATLINEAAFYWHLDEYSRSLELFNEGIQILSECNEFKWLSIAYGNLGNVYGEMGNYSKALECYYKCQKMLIELKDEHNEAQVILNIGTTYVQLNDYRSALKEYYKSLEIFEKLEDSFSIGMTLMNIGNAYILQKDYDNGMAFNVRALTYFEKMDNDLLIVKPYHNIGEVYMIKGEFEKAHEYFIKTLEISEEHNSKSNIAKSLADLTQFHERDGNKYADIDKGIEYGLRAAKILKEIKSQIMLKVVSETLSKLYSKKKDYESALKHHIEYVDILNEQFSEESTRKINNLRIYHQVEETKKQNEIIRIKNLELAEINEKLSIVSAAKDKFINILAHDLKNPVQVLTFSSEILAKHFDKYPKEKLRDNLERINKQSTHIANLLENMLQWARTQSGNLEADPLSFDINEIIDEAILLAREQAYKKSIELVKDTPNGAFVYADENMVFTVLRNILTNAIKFTPEKGKITIGVKHKDDKTFTVFIKDTGIGMKKEVLEKLFRIDVNHTTLGTSKEKGTGLGLIISKEFVELNGGEIWVESQEGKGSTFYFTVPKPTDF